MGANEKIAGLLNAWKNPGSARLDLRVLHELSHDPRAAIRVQVAELTGRIVRHDTELIESILYRLVIDTSAGVCRAAVESFGRLLLRSSGMVRSRIACEWAAAWNSFARQAVAIALRDERIRFVGEAAVLDHLASDSLASIRQAAASAAAARVRARPDRCLEVLGGLSADSQREVRLRAIDGLEKIATRELAPRVVRCVSRSTTSPDLPTAGKAARVIVRVTEKAPDEVLDVCEDLSINEEPVQPLVLADMARAVGRLYPRRPLRTQAILSRLSSHREPKVRMAALQGLSHDNEE